MFRCQGLLSKLPFWKESNPCVSTFCSFEKPGQGAPKRLQYSKLVQYPKRNVETFWSEGLLSMRLSLVWKAYLGLCASLFSTFKTVFDNYPPIHSTLIEILHFFCSFWSFLHIFCKSLHIFSKYVTKNWTGHIILNVYCYIYLFF